MKPRTAVVICSVVWLFVGAVVDAAPLPAFPGAEGWGAVSVGGRDGRVIKKEYFDKTTAFFEKHGAKALVLGRFVPIVRTYITVVAGIGRMERRHFFTWSAVGALLWVVIVTLAGYFLGGVAFVRDNLEAAILLIVFLSVLPMVFEFLKYRREAKRVAADAVEETAEVIQDAADTLTDDHR